MMYFLTGFQRSGSSILARMLLQNSAIHVDDNSCLYELIGGVATKWSEDELLGIKRPEKQLIKILQGMMHAVKEQAEKSIFIDKNHQWALPVAMRTMTKVLGQSPKIITTVRSIPDCAASFVKNEKPQDLQAFLTDSPLLEKLKVDYGILQAGMQEDPLAFCVIEFDDLIKNPKGQLDKIHAFLGLEPFEYEIESSANWHQEDAREVLGFCYNKFDAPRFWRGETQASIAKKPLDLQLEAAQRGEFEKSWEICQQIERTEPENNRAAYNRGLFVLMQGRLQEGMELLARGRIEKVFGDSRPKVPTNIWDGSEGKMVLLYLEGGFGDQIHQMRFIQDITARKCRVIVACSPTLVKLCSTIPNVHAVVVHEAAPGIFHDAWVPGMSAPIPLGIQYENVWGRPYIPRPMIKKDKFRIGLRWQGNPNFEHDHRKYFDPQLLFKAVQGHDVEFVSLQRDEGAQHRPEWVAESKMDSWEETQLVAGSCDLVISSCTSVAHLSAAMGVPTWVVIPILPYYIWAIPGEKVPWYDSVRLFRQTKHDDWTEIFEQVRVALNNHLNGVDHGRLRLVG